VISTGPSGDRPGTIVDGALPGGLAVRNLEADMDIAGVGGVLRIGRLGARPVLEQFDHQAPRQVDEGRVDHHARMADDGAEIGLVEDGPPALDSRGSPARSGAPQSMSATLMPTWCACMIVAPDSSAMVSPCLVRQIRNIASAFRETAACSSARSRR
jgi:hypothetical protein